MFNKFLFRKLMIVIFAVLSFSSQALIAKDDEIAFLGASYSSDSFIGINAFYTDNWDWYTSITAAIPFDDGEFKASGNRIALDSQFSMNDIILQHIGFFITDYKSIPIGIGFVWGGSSYNNPAYHTEGFVRVGVEVPILYQPIKDFPILILPSYESMLHADGKKWNNNRYGVTFIGHLLFLNPLTFQLESGIYNNNIGFKPHGYEIESGVGFNWKISVGFSF